MIRDRGQSLGIEDITRIRRGEKIRKEEDTIEHILGIDQDIQETIGMIGQSLEIEVIQERIEEEAFQEMESHELAELRNIVKENGNYVMRRFRNKFRELKVEPNRGKVTEALYMGSQSESRKRFHDKRQRSESRNRGYYQDKKRREDLQGRGYYRAYSRDRSRYSRDYRNDRSQSRDRGNSRENRGRSVSRNGDRRDSRSKSRDRSQEVFERCIACRCKRCIKMREKLFFHF